MAGLTLWLPEVTLGDQWSCLCQIQLAWSTCSMPPASMHHPYFQQNSRLGGRQQPGLLLGGSLGEDTRCSGGLLLLGLGGEGPKRQQVCTRLQMEAAEGHVSHCKLPHVHIHGVCNLGISMHLLPIGVRNRNAVSDA